MSDSLEYKKQAGYATGLASGNDFFATLRLPSIPFPQQRIGNINNQT